jgi:hypothetical protein
MGILDSKTTILDLSLTDLGRELLSKDQLNFTYYAFSDVGIDYSGSFLKLDKMHFSGIMTGSTYDDFIHTEFFNIEADQKKGYNKDEPLDMETFLYTVPMSNKVLPEIRLSTSGTLTIKRTYKKVKPENIDDIGKLGPIKGVVIPYQEPQELLVPYKKPQGSVAYDEEYRWKQLGEKFGTK